MIVAAVMCCPMTIADTRSLGPTVYGWHCESVQSVVGSRSAAGEGLKSLHLFRVAALRGVEVRVGARAGDYIENPIG